MRDVLLVAGASVCLLTGCGSNTEVRAPSLLSYGLGIELPSDWQGYVGRGLLVARSSTLADPGPGWLDAGPSGPDGAQIVVLEHDSEPPLAPLTGYDYVTGAVAVRRGDFDQGCTLTATETTNQSVACRAVEVSGRRFEVFVALGVAQPDVAQVAAANRVLAMLRVDDVPPPTGSVPPPRFSPLEGWLVADSGLQLWRVEGNDGYAIASTSQIQDAPEAIPDRSVAALAPGGALIQVRLQQNALLPFTRAPRSRLPTVGALPASPPGGDRPGVTHLRDSAELNDRSYNITIDAYFKSPLPSAAMIGHAQAILDQLVLPDWGVWDPNAQRVPKRLSFAFADGWHNVQTIDQHDPRVQFAWTANVPLAGDDARTREPRDTAMTLPRNGILVTASSRPEVADATSYVEMSQPLTLASGRFFTSQYENQPAPNVSKYAISAKIHGGYVNIEVLFGTPRPSPQVRSTAERALQRLVVP